MKRSLSRIPYIIVPSPFLSKFLGQVFSLSYRVIEHGIFPFSPLPRNEKQEGLHFGYIGSLLPQKGWHLALEAFELLRAKYSQVKLSFYGGRKPDNFSDRPGVTFAGVYEQSDLPKITAHVDIGIIPSVFRETYCLTLSELWMGSVPVAASDLGALGDRVKDGINGKKFKAGDVSSICETLEWFVTHTAWREWEIKTPRSVMEMCSEYRSFYLECLSPSKRAST